jgi:hypothetical protein
MSGPSGGDLIRGSVRLVIQEPEENAASQSIGAGRYYPTETRQPSGMGPRRGW